MVRLRSLWNGARMMRPSELALRRAECPVCGSTFLIKLRDRPLGVRCLRCRTSLTYAALIQALKQELPNLAGCHVYELSSRGTVLRYLKRHAGRITCSEYLDGAKPGELRQGLRCEDVQALTWPDNSFDACTSTEVFEHVPDDMRGFREVLRVLKPGGLLALTVPLDPSRPTRERARLTPSGIEHLLPPEYHGDHLRGAGKVLAFRDYGSDIIERLRTAGFSVPALHRFPAGDEWFGFARHAVTARKPG